MSQGLSKEDFSKAIKWEDSADLKFGAEAIFAVLVERVGQKNVEINLAQIGTEYATQVSEMYTRVAPELAGRIKILDESELTSRQRKEMVKGLKKLVRLNFLEIVESNNWKEHVVNILPVWE